MKSAQRSYLQKKYDFKLSLFSYCFYRSCSFSVFIIPFFFSDASLLFNYKIFFIFIKIVLVFLALPAVFFDLAGLFGLGILGVMAFQGYPVIGCVIIAFGVVLSMTAYILFLFTYVLGGRGAKA